MREKGGAPSVSYYAEILGKGGPANPVPEPTPVPAPFLISTKGMKTVTDLLDEYTGLWHCEPAVTIGSPMGRKRAYLLGTCLFLAVETFAIYSSVTSHPFATLDDHEYVTGNAHVQVGLTWQSLPLGLYIH